MSKRNEIKQNIAIVLGPKCVNATGLIRSLGEAGFFVIFASTYSKLESKWTKEYLRLPKDEEAQIEVLYRYICTLPSKPAIFTVDDCYNELLDENYELFKKVAFIPHACGRLKEVCDKAIMSQIAKDSGLKVPAFEKVSVLDGKTTLHFPVIVKPYAGYAGSKGDICLCHTQEDWFTCMKNLREKKYTEVLVQELIEEENQFELGLMGIALPNGEVKIPCSIKKIRSYPEGRGSTSYAQVKKDFFGIQEESLKAFVRNTGYIGLFDIEMIVANGVGYFIEINYRNGQYGYAVTKAGYNLPKNWFNGMLGEAVEKDVSIKEIFYINEREDKLNVRDGKISKKEWKRQFKEASAYGLYCKGDKRPYIRQYVKIPDRIKIKARSFFERIKDLLVKEEWNIAIRLKGKKLLFEDKDTSGFTVLKNSVRYWCADPFIVSKEDKEYLFFEMYDRYKAKGAIGCRIIENGKIGKMKKVYETPTHLSFPNVFFYNGDAYMLPESCGSGKLSLLKAAHFPYDWQEERVLLDRKVCDSAFLSVNDKVYLLTQPLDVVDARLELYEIIDGRAYACEANLVVQGKKESRMAGAIVHRGGKNIRVAQDCLMGYGVGLRFHEIYWINDRYSENFLTSVEIADMPKRQRGKYVGIHTYNISDNYEVIDLKNKNRIRWGNIVNIFYRLFRR